MTDPFDSLREPVVPVDPAPAFAARLRDRLTRAVLAQSGADMTTQLTPSAQRQAAWPATLTPYIVVADARRARDWYVEVFGAEQRGELYANDDGTIGHAEIGIGDAVLMFAEASDLWPDVPVRAPDSPMHSHTLHLQVEDVDATTERARTRGASVEREPTDQPYGRGSVIVDPFGHRWILLRPPAWATRFRQGDVARVTMVTADTDRAKDFYEAVLQVPFHAGSQPGVWNTEETQPHLGIWSPEDVEPQIQLVYRVDDLDAALGRVRAAGGIAGEAERKPYGLKATCEDDQGVVFELWQPSD
ncbi:MAG: VOC family protein [Actinophytocola sp.]|uniref:VOC family protein n=1 Tax=Actinophytocola sp. TaxID=1872138 RepID=UPI003D6ADA28